MNDYEIPVRQDITVLQGDEPRSLKFGWIVKEYNGHEIYKLTYEMKNKLTYSEIYDDRAFPYDSDKSELIYHKSLTKKEDLKAGDEVILKDSPFDYIWDIGTVEEYQGNLIIRISENYVAFIEFDKDDRHCWSTTCVCNLKALEKVEFNGVIK